MLECTGLGNPRAIRDLRRLIAEREPSLFFISETKFLSSQFRNWTYQFKFKGCFPIDCTRRSGGLVFLWREPFDVSIQSFSGGHIDCVNKYGDFRWRFTGFYGNPVASLRGISWKLLHRLGDIHELRHLPWLVGGDFNEILFELIYESVTSLLGYLDICGLHDLPYTGPRFTWSNKRQGDNLIFARLDRFVCNQAWQSIFPHAEALNLEFAGSDHRPIS